MKLYHIDRKNTLKEGMILDFEILNKDIVFDNMFDSKLTPFGVNYLLAPFEDSTIIDSIFEMVRVKSFPDKISRYQCFFATDKNSLLTTLTSIGCCDNDFKIYEVESELYEKYDMSLLKTGGCVGNCMNYAYRYWNCEHSKVPCYEYLLKPPVKVIKEVSLEEAINSNS